VQGAKGLRAVGSQEGRAYGGQSEWRAGWLGAVSGRRGGEG
jgi:hypothetical protein